MGEFKREYSLWISDDALDQMKLAEKKNRCGRPLMKATDKKRRKYIMTLRYIGEQATFSIGIAAAKASVEQGENKSLKVLKISKGLGPKLILNSAYSFNIPHQLIF